MVRVPLGPVPPAALNGLSFFIDLPWAIESHSGSLPEVESSTSPFEASGVPFLILWTNCREEGSTHTQ